MGQRTKGEIKLMLIILNHSVNYNPNSTYCQDERLGLKPDARLHSGRAAERARQHDSPMVGIAQPICNLWAGLCRTVDTVQSSSTLDKAKLR